MFAVYGPVTPALREEFLNDRKRMNEATLRGKLDSLRIQKERIETRKKTPELADPSIQEMLIDRLKQTEQDVADLKADRYQKAIDLGRPNSAAFRSATSGGDCSAQKYDK